MLRARVLIAFVGVLLPYLARVPGALSAGSDWLTSYLQSGIWGFLFIGGFNAVAWGTLLALSFLLRKPAPLILPTVLGFAFLAYAHANLDLSSDAQAAVALVFIPIYAVPIIVVAFVVSAPLFGRAAFVPLRRRAERNHENADAPEQSVLQHSSDRAHFACTNCGRVVKYGASHCHECDQAFRYS